MGLAIVSLSKTRLRCPLVHTTWREKRCQAVGQVSAAMATFDAALPPSHRELIVKNQQRLDVWRQHHTALNWPPKNGHHKVCYF